MQHLEACLLIAEADSVLCHLVMFFTVLRGPGSEVWNRVYMIAPVKKFGRVRLSTNFLQNKCGGEWTSDEFLLVFFFQRANIKKGFQEIFKWNFWTSRGIMYMYEWFMGNFTFRDSASRQVQLFISSVNFTSDQPAQSLIFFHLQRY